MNAFVDGKQGLRRAERRNTGQDADRIGAFAGIGGLVEVGLGSTLHAYHVPLKGHILSSLQNLMLITFGKALNGRGLVRISFISAMLKAFSPIGNRFRPMLYIFLQGLAFSSPVRLLGWNAGSVLLGSVLMGWLTLGISLTVDYVTFGKSIFDAFSGAVASVSHWLGFQSPPLLRIIVGTFIFKAFISLGLGALAYWGNMQPLIRRLCRQEEHQRPAAATTTLAGRNKKGTGRRIVNITLLALKDLFRPHYIIMFLLSILLMRFFVDLSNSALVSLVVRGLCISYLGFLLMRHIDIHALGIRLDRMFGMDLARSLPIALKIIGRPFHQPQDPEDREEKGINGK